MKKKQTLTRLQAGLYVGALLCCSVGAGCQIEAGGQVLPSPWYLTDDVQYYAPGPEFKLAREAAAMQEAAEEEIIEGR